MCCCTQEHTLVGDKRRGRIRGLTRRVIEVFLAVGRIRLIVFVLPSPNLGLSQPTKGPGY